MSNGNDAVAMLSAGVQEVIGPLLTLLDDPAELAALAGRAGWLLRDLDALPAEALTEAKDAIDAALAVLTDGDLAMDDLGDATAALTSLAAVFTAVRGARDAMSAGFGVPVDGGTLAMYSADLLDMLVLRAMDGGQPVAAQVLRLLGIIEKEQVAPVVANGTELRPAGERSVLRPANAATLLTTPAEHLAAATLPDGLADEAAARASMRHLFTRVRALVMALGGETYVGLEGATPAEVADPANAAALRTAAVRLPLPGADDPVPDTIGVVVTALPDGVAGTVGPVGPGFELRATGVVDVQATVGDWTVEARVTGDAGATFVSATEVATLGGGAALEIALTLTKGLGDVPALRIGGEQGTRLEIGRIVTTAQLTLSGEAPDWGLGATLAPVTIVVSAGDADSFLASLLPDGGISTELDLGLVWSQLGGLQLGGGAGLEATVPLDVSILGLITIQALRVAIEAAEEGLGIDLGLTASGALGPFTASVDGIGLTLGVGFPADQSGALGPVDLSIAFRPPDGIGLDVAVGDVMQGGGYLYIDADRGEYAGVMDMSVIGVGITAIGLISTQLPDGTDGWSMFLSLSARFTGVQLGFGFTLNGVGGLVGVNRSLDEEALGDGIRTGALDSILFPEDPVADAPRILADLGAVFPPAAGQFVFGPIARIGWGTPTIVEVDLGVVIQLPEPLTVTLLGALSCVLPSADVPVLSLHVDVAGTANLTEGTLRIDASVHDSHVAGFELTGDMAVRASFLEDTTFLVSFGGFHPEFDPGDDFPSLARLGIALDTGDELRIQIGGYFALTSNTVQFGAELSFWADGGGFTVQGGTSIDALIQFSPFGFRVGIEFWVSVSAGNTELLGVQLSGLLTGPNPWYVAGAASFKILGIRMSLDVGATFGDRESEDPIEVVNVTELLIAELRLPDAWSAAPPTGDGDGVLLADGIDANALHVHPSGRVMVRQRLVPLDTPIDHYGNASLGDGDTFTLDAPRLGTLAVADDQIEGIDDWFATASYFRMGEDEKLEAPSFEEMRSGLGLGDDGVDGGPDRAFVRDHEVVYRDPNGAAPATDVALPAYVATTGALSRSLRSSPARHTRLGSGMPRSDRFTSPFAVRDVRWVAQSAGTGEISEGITSRRGTSWHAARTALAAAHVAAPQTLVPSYERQGRP